MKSQVKLFFGLLATTSIVSFAGAAQAGPGQGGAAGAAAFSLDSSGRVTNVAVSAAVGKQDAAALSINNPVTGLQSYALGSAGVITQTTASSTSGATQQGTPDPNLGTAQNNQLGNTGAAVGVTANTTNGNLTLGQ